MRVVIDTNIIISTLSKTSPYRPIIHKLIAEEFDLFVSTSILLEYQEVITRKTNIEVAKNFLELLVNRPNVFRIDARFNWQLITNDPDDDRNGEP